MSFLCAATANNRGLPSVAGANLEQGESVYTVRELAGYLRTKPLTIYKHAQSGKLPGFKIGSHWRFKRLTIDRWIQEQEQDKRAS